MSFIKAWKKIQVELRRSNHHWQGIQTGTMRSSCIFNASWWNRFLVVSLQLTLGNCFEIEVKWMSKGDMTHVLSVFIPAGNLQWLCKAFLGSEGNLEITGGGQGRRQQVRTLCGLNYNQTEKNNKILLPASVRSIHRLRLILCLENGRILWLSLQEMLFHPVDLRD